MKKNYFKHVALAMGIVAVAGTANADWSDVTGQYVKNTSFIPSWQGSGISGFGFGCAEAWDTPFEIYQVINDAKAGKYTLTLNAFYRHGSNDGAKVDMVDGANHHAYAFLGTEKKAVEGLFDKTKETYPNSMEEAAAEFAKGEYVTTIEFNHEGGDLKFGLVNPVDVLDQWTIFDNFKLVGPDGEITVPNGGFDEGFVDDKDDQTVWDHKAVDGSNRRIQVNGLELGNGGGKGCFRLANASARNYGQLIDLPAGKYRFGMQSFFRHGHGSSAGARVALKSDSWEDNVVTGYDNHVAGNEADADFPVIYVSDPYPGEELANSKPYAETDGAEIIEAGKMYLETPVKCLFDEQLDKYPDNVPSASPTPAGERGWNDSGFEQQAATVFINNPELYRNYVEFELTAPAKVWVGFKKDVNAPAGWWWAFRNVTLEKYVASEGSAVNEVEVADENAPVEYYNLQGIRVANPENGLYIVKQGKKVTKQIFK